MDHLDRALGPGLTADSTSAPISWARAQTPIAVRLLGLAEQVCPRKLWISLVSPSRIPMRGRMVYPKRPQLPDPVSRPQALIPQIADAPVPIPSNSGAGPAIRIRLCASARISIPHLSSASSRTRNWCKPRFRACALTRSAVAARRLSMALASSVAMRWRQAGIAHPESCSP